MSTNKISGLGGMIRQKLYGSAKNIAKGAKTLTSKKDYVSTKGPNYGNTYTRYGGVVSVLKKSATPATTKQANEQRQAARIAVGHPRKVR